MSFYENSVYYKFSLNLDWIWREAIIQIANEPNMCPPLDTVVTIGDIVRCGLAGHMTSDSWQYGTCAINQRPGHQWESWHWSWVWGDTTVIPVPLYTHINHQ